MQLHCPPTATFSDDAVFDVLDALVAEGSIAGYGVSVETCDEALTAIARPGVVSVQIILNAFRLKPLDRVLPAAAAAGVGIIARVPLASGLLSGRYTSSTTFGADDHRNYNRSGAAFDVGETFSGVDFETGLAAVDDLTAALPDGSLAAANRACAGSSTSRESPPSSLAPATRRRHAETRRPAGFRGHQSRISLRRFADTYDASLRDDIHPRW